MRRHETPNAVMTTIASPDLDGAELAVWRVTMDPGSAGPVHVVDRDQVLVVVAGELAVDTEGAARDVGTGESVTLRAGTTRQVRNDGSVAAEALVASRPSAIASTAERQGVLIPWTV